MSYTYTILSLYFALFSIPLKANKGVINSVKEAVLPFHLINGMIGVTVTVNDQEGLYLLDSGASDLIINAKPRRHDETFASVYGDIEAEKVDATLSVGPIYNHKTEAWRIDLTAFEKKIGTRISGLIGGAALEDHDIMIDYMTQRIVFLDYSPHGLEVSPFRRVVTLPFKTHFQNLPVVEATIDNREVLLGFDTGANTNVFSGDLIDGHEENETIDFGLIRLEISDDSTESMKPLKTPDGSVIDGILSASSLKADQIIISYRRSKIYLLYDQLLSSN